MIQIKREGRRYYLEGDTYALRETLRREGCKWDRDVGAWWTGKKETAEMLVGDIKSGAVQPSCTWVKLVRGFGVLVPAGLSHQTGDTVDVSGKSSTSVTLGEVAEKRANGDLVYRRVLAPKQPTQLTALVGTRTELASTFEASKRNRTPHRSVGERCVLNVPGRGRIPVVVCGYKPATYMNAEDAEDFGHYQHHSGYFGTLYYQEVAAPHTPDTISASQ